MVPDYAQQAAALLDDDFDPAPWFYLIYTRVYFVIGIFIFLLGYYCIWWMSPTGTKTSFKRLYILMITFSFGMHLFAYSSAPLFITPYRAAIYSAGFASGIGIPPSIQLSMLFICSQGISSYSLALFYYRIEVLLPTGHFFRRKGLSYFFYGFSFTSYIPAFFIGYFEGSQNQDQIKHQFFEEYGYVTAYLWDSRTTVFRFSFKDTFLITFLTYVCLACFIPFAIISPVLFCTMSLLAEFRSKASKRTAVLQWNLLKTLIAQITIYFTVFSGSITFIGIGLLSNVGQNIITIAACIFGASPSLGVLTMIFVNGYYRRAVLRCFLFRFNEVSSSSVRDRMSTLVTKM